jgi:hypothetical protein
VAASFQTCRIPSSLVGHSTFVIQARMRFEQAFSLMPGSENL